jgi:predicted Zn-dependent protease
MGAIEIPPLDAPDRFYASAVEGWLQLGNLTEAKAELAMIGKAWRDHPEVLHVTWQVHAQEKSWERCLEVAQRCITASPQLSQGYIHRSFALHEMKRTREAWDQLQPQARRFADEPIVAYNLACYACQLGNLKAARQWLRRATKLGGADKITAMALRDQDLKPLWNKLRPKEGSD